MRKLLLIIFLFAFLEGKAQTVIRVVNGQNLQTVIDNATAGSTIMVEAGTYGSINVNKKIEFIGTGYNLNNSITAYIGVSILGNVNFLVGSEQSKIQGFQAGDINVGANSVWVQRNKCATIRIGNNGSVALRADNVLVRQNTGERPEVTTQSIGFQIKNNIFYSGFYFDTAGLGQVINNTFNGGYFTGKNNYLNTEFRNNIITQITDLRQGSLGYIRTGDNFIINFFPFFIQNNVFQNYIPTLTTTNTINANFTNMYLAFPNNPDNLQEDARYQLHPNSPAKGAGENGTDAGAFGGDEPYILSGIPSIPAIYQLTVPANVPQGGTLNVQIKAKTNN